MPHAHMYVQMTQLVDLAPTPPVQYVCVYLVYLVYLVYFITVCLFYTGCCLMVSSHYENSEELPSLA